MVILQGGPGGLTENSVKKTLHPSDFGLANDPGSWFASELQSGDFDCDGFDDLAISVSHLAVDGTAEAGSVALIKGGPSSLDTAKVNLVDKNDLNFNAAGEGDHFGETLAAGNFNGDQQGGNPCVDLAIGVPRESGGGAVYVLYGSPSLGITLQGQQRIAQGSSGVSGTPEDGDQFGADLAITRANNDEFDDLVVGAFGDQADSGSGHVLLGSASGIASSGHAIFRGKEAPVPDYLEQADNDPFLFADRVGGTSDGVVMLSSSAQAWRP